MKTYSNREEIKQLVKEGKADRSALSRIKEIPKNDKQLNNAIKQILNAVKDNSASMERASDINYKLVQNVLNNLATILKEQKIDIPAPIVNVEPPKPVREWNFTVKREHDGKYKINAKEVK